MDHLQSVNWLSAESVFGYRRVYFMTTYNFADSS